MNWTEYILREFSKLSITEDEMRGFTLNWKRYRIILINMNISFKYPVFQIPENYAQLRLY